MIPLLLADRLHRHLETAMTTPRLEVPDANPPQGGTGVQPAPPTAEERIAKALERMADAQERMATGFEEIGALAAASMLLDADTEGRET